MLRLHLAGSDGLPDPGEKTLVKNDTTPRKPRDGKIYGIFQRNSVHIDTFLRLFGAIGLMSPVSKWRAPTWKEKLNDNPWTLFGGAGFLASKPLTWVSKVPDPYNPEPHTWLDGLREKVTFRLSSISELAACFALAYDNFAKHNPCPALPTSSSPAGSERASWRRSARAI